MSVLPLKLFLNAFVIKRQLLLKKIMVLNYRIVYIMKGRIEDLKIQIIICVLTRTAVVTVLLNEPVEIPRRFCKTK